MALKHSVAAAAAAAGSSLDITGKFDKGKAERMIGKSRAAQILAESRAQTDALAGPPASVALQPVIPKSPPKPCLKRTSLTPHSSEPPSKSLELPALPAFPGLPQFQRVTDTVAAGQNSIIASADGSVVARIISEQEHEERRMAVDSKTASVDESTLEDDSFADARGRPAGLRAASSGPVSWPLPPRQVTARPMNAEDSVSDVSSDDSVDLKAVMKLLKRSDKRTKKLTKRINEWHSDVAERVEDVKSKLGVVESNVTDLTSRMSGLEVSQRRSVKDRPPTTIALESWNPLSRRSRASSTHRMLLVAVALPEALPLEMFALAGRSLSRTSRTAFLPAIGSPRSRNFCQVIFLTLPTCSSTTSTPRLVT